MNRLERLFPPGRVVVADGGWGAELIRLGLKVGESADLWNQARPEVVEAVARSFVEAGAEVLLTNTFQANPVALRRFGKADEAAAVNRLGVEISRRAASSVARAVRVFGAIGPVGLGRIDRRSAADAFALQARTLADAGVDALLFETFGDLDEARLAVESVRPLDLPIVVSFHFDDRSEEPLTFSDATPEEAARAVREAGADGVGANCGSDLASFPELCARLRAAAELPVWIKPNAGIPTFAFGRADYPVGPKAFAAILSELAAAGAAVVGGCCGAGPDHVRALAAARGGSTDLITEDAENSEKERESGEDENKGGGGENER